MFDFNLSDFSQAYSSLEPRTSEGRYRNDPLYHRLVDTVVDVLDKNLFTIKDVKGAVKLAESIHKIHKTRRIRR